MRCKTGITTTIPALPEFHRPVSNAMVNAASRIHARVIHGFASPRPRPALSRDRTRKSGNPRDSGHPLPLLPFRFLRSNSKREHGKAGRNQSAERADEAPAARARRRGDFAAAVLADAPGGALSAGIPRAASERGELPRILSSRRRAPPRRRCSRSAASAWMGRSCSRTFSSCRTAWARPWRFREGEGPVLERLHTREDVEALRSEGIVERLAPVYETVQRVKTVLPADAALIGFAGGPWTVATYMVEGGTSRDFAATKRWAFGDRDGFALLIALLTEATIAHLSAQIAAGAEIVQIFESWAGVLDAASFRRWVIEPTHSDRGGTESAPSACAGDRLSARRGVDVPRLCRRDRRERGRPRHDRAVRASRSARCRAWCRCKAISIRWRSWSAARRWRKRSLRSSPPSRAGRSCSISATASCRKRRSPMSHGWPSCCVEDHEPHGGGAVQSRRAGFARRRSSRSSSICFRTRRSSRCPIRCAVGWRGSSRAGARP